MSKPGIRIKLIEIFQIWIVILSLILIQFDYSLKGIELFLFLIFVECVIISFKSRFFNIFQLLLFMFLYFNLSIPFFHLIGFFVYPADNMLMYDAAIKVPVSDNTLVLTYKVMICVLCGVSVGWLHISDNSDYSCYYDKDVNDENNKMIWDDIFHKLFWALWIFEIIYQLILVSMSIEDGYVETMHLHSKAGIIIKILNIVSEMFPIISFWVLFKCREKREFVKIATIICIPYLIQIFTGYRAGAFCTALVFLYIYSRYFGKITIRQVVIAFFVMIFLIVGIGAYRWSRNLSDFFNLENGLTKFIIDEFLNSSESIIVLSYTIQLMDQFTNRVPFLLGYFFATFSFAPNYSNEGILSKSYLSQHITYILNPAKLYHGSTIGTNISAEFYEFSNGSFVVITILSIGLMIATGLFLRRLYKNQMWFYFGASYLKYFLMSPRGSVMKIFNKVSLVYIIFFIIMYSISSHSKRKLYIKKTENEGGTYV